MKIGIPARIMSLDGRKKIFTNESYLSYLEKEELTPIIITKESFYDIKDLCNGFLIPGGDDIDASYYGEKNHYTSILSDKKTDELDRMIISYAYQENTPLFGICRGIQAINVFLGGSLYQDVQDHKNKKVDTFIPTPNTLFSEIYYNNRKINSYHHQAIKKLADGFLVGGTSHNIVEAIYHKEKPIMAVEWHPELLNDEESKKLLRHFKRMLTNKSS